MKMIYGSSNENKVKDIKGIIKSHKVDIEILSLADIGFKGEIIEDGDTFEQNSEIKAIAIREFCDKNEIKYDLVTADDAGLCVDCLDGAPGVYSARYAGDHAPQEVVLNKLLSNINRAGDRDRKAEFVCVLTSFLRDGTKIVSRGECKGSIAREVGKLGGLTYSPVFIPEGFTVPMSELDVSEYEKAHNHRDKAFGKLLGELNKKYRDGQGT